MSYRAPSRSRYLAQPPNFCQPNISRKNTASRNLVPTDDLLDFWRNNEQLGIYPHLCQLAKLHLSTYAASVPVECLFSTTGLIANSKRSSLSADRLHKITFIHDNCKLAFQWLDFSIWVTLWQWQTNWTIFKLSNSAYSIKRELLQSIVLAVF